MISAHTPILSRRARQYTAKAAMLDPVVVAAAVILSAFFLVVFSVSLRNALVQMAAQRGGAHGEPRVPRLAEIPHIMTLSGINAIQLSAHQWAWIMDDPAIQRAPYLIRLPNGSYNLGNKST